MLLSAVPVLVVAQSISEIPEGLINNPVYLVSSTDHDAFPQVGFLQPSGTSSILCPCNHQGTTFKILPLVLFSYIHIKTRADYAHGYTPYTIIEVCSIFPSY